MNPFTQKLMQLAAGIMFALPLGGCASLSAEPLEGQVLEEGTSKPIANAIVIVRWDKTYSSFVDTTTVCVHVESALTDVQGRYRLPRWRGKTPDHINTFKTGYERSQEYFRAKAYLQHNDILKPFTGGREERLKYLQRVEGNIRSCRSPEAGEKNLLPLYRALYEEAKPLARTREEQIIRDGFLAAIEKLELGYKEGMRRALERAEKRDRQP